MSKLFKFIGKVDPVAEAIDKKIMGEKGLISGQEAKERAKKEAAATAAAAGAPSAAGVQKALEYTSRQGRIEAAATAAGAVRSESDTDVLGRDNFAPKKKRASKDLLG